MRIFFYRNWKLLCLFVLALGTLTACLVDDDGGAIIPLNSNSAIYPIYKNGDFVEYTITGTVTLANTTIPRDASGSLRITWEDQTIPFDPFLKDPVPIDAIRETSVLVIDQLNTFTSVRYIQQDPVTHAIKLVAVEDSEGKLFWISPVNSIAQNPTTPVPLGATIFDSPIPDNIAAVKTYYVLANCSSDTQSCQEMVATVKTTTEFARIVTEGTKTRAGLFETARVNVPDKEFKVSAGITNASANYLPFYRLDNHASCSSAESPNTVNNGDFDVHPSVGIVFMFIGCNALNSATADSYSLYVELSSYGITGP